MGTFLGMLWDIRKDEQIPPVVDSFPAVADALLVAQVTNMLLCTVSPHILSGQKLVPHDASARRTCVNEFCNSRLRNVHLQQRLPSPMNHAVIEWKRSCDSNTSLAAMVFKYRVCWNCRLLPHRLSYFYPHEFVAPVILIFFEYTEMDYRKMCPPFCACACGFSTTAVHHIAVVRCINGCLKNVGRWIVYGSEASVSCPACSPRLNALDLPVGVF